MTNKIVINEIINTVLKIRGKIYKYEELLRKNEMLVRYALIDPFLKVLGWDTEDPEQVIPEYNTEAGVPDYALKVDGEVKAFIEAKALRKRWDILKLISYANAQGVPYVIATDGDKWEIYDVFKPVIVDEKLVTSWQITKDNPANIALKALSIANLKEIFGIPPTTPILIKETTKQKEKIMHEEERKLLEGPLDSNMARILILQILAEADKSLKIMEIVKKIEERVKFTKHDLERTKSGRIRWKATVRWAISRLYKEGLIDRVEEGTYRINKKGIKELKRITSKLIL